MIVGVGIDIVENSRIYNAISTYKHRFIKKILTKEELNQLNVNKLSTQHLAGVFAAKEAVIKSLSSLLGCSLTFQEISFKKGLTVIPEVIINSKEAKDKLNNVRLSISISHEKYYSIALSIAEII